jgi:4-hydroxy-3-methylbut-2-enyl diphosphate reductase
LCEEKLPTYFINDEEKIVSNTEIVHYNYRTKMEEITSNFIPNKKPVKILLTSGASCPDALVEGVIRKLVSFFPGSRSIDDLLEEMKIPD